MATSSKVSIGRFRNICFVGLNRVELHPAEGDALFAENWLDITDEHARKNLMLAFFAPHDLNGDPVDPAEVLLGNLVEEEGYQALQQLKGISLFDMCRGQRAAPNEVNVLIVADVIYHWDASDNYIQPTSPDSWAQDLQHLLKYYPRTTVKNVYTDWDTAMARDLDGVNFFPVKEMPLDATMWVNRPSLQDKYGTYFLILGILCALGAFGANHMAGSSLDVVENQIRGLAMHGDSSNLRDIQQKIVNIDKFMRYRSLFSLAFKDVGSAIHDARFKVKTFTLQTPTTDNRTAPEDLIVDIDAYHNNYPNYDTQEPAAKEILSHSISMVAIRKPSGNAPDLFSLEGLIPLDRLATMISSYQSLAQAAQSDAVDSSNTQDAKKAQKTPAPAARTTGARAQAPFNARKGSTR